MSAQFIRIASTLFAQPWLIQAERHAALVAQFKRAVQTRAMKVSLEDEDLPISPKRQVQASELADGDCLSDVRIIDGVAVLPVHGILGKHLSLLDMLCGGYDLRTLESQVLALENRTDVHTVVTHWNSPGGQASGVAETAQILLKLGESKTHLAYCDMACSGAYWLASTASLILCGPSAVMGSISAVCAIEDISQMYADLGIKVDVFTDGDQKGAGIPGTSLSEAQRQGIQERIEAIGGMFKDFVKSRREGLTDDLLQGQWFYGQQALSNGLADESCPSIDHALALALAAADGP